MPRCAVLPRNPRAGEGLRTEPTAAAQRYRRELIFMPLKRPSRPARELAQVPGLRTFASFKIRPPAPPERRSNWDERRPRWCSARRRNYQEIFIGPVARGLSDPGAGSDAGVRNYGWGVPASATCDVVSETASG